MESSENNTESFVPNYVRAFIEQKVQAINKAKREILHLITAPSVDRIGDIVEPGGADLTNFLKNPVVMANHDYSIEKVVGRAISVEVTKDGISARTAFRDTPLARDAFALASEGLGGWSIGFRPTDYEPLKDAKGAVRGLRFKRWELLEYSVVAIPANPDIVNNAVQRGLVTEVNVRTFFDLGARTEPAPAEAASTRTNEQETVVVVRSPALVSAVERVRRRLECLEAAEKIEAALGRQ